MSSEKPQVKPQPPTGAPQPPTDFSYDEAPKGKSAADSKKPQPKRKFPKAALIAILAVAVVAGGAFWLFTSGPLSQQGAQIMMGDSYSDNLSPDKYTLNTPERDVDDKHTFTFDLDDGVDLGMEKVDYGDGTSSNMGDAAGAVRVYADGGLTQEVPVDVHQVEDEDGNRLEVAPTNVVVNDLSRENGDMDIDMFRNDESNSDEFAFGRWYGYDGYYLVRYIGSDGKKLDKPEVTFFTVKDDVSSNEDALPAPSVNFSVADNGGLDVSWSPVEGAERYKVYLQVINKNSEETTERYGYALLAETDGDATSINTEDYDFTYQRLASRDNAVDDYYGTGETSSYAQNYQFQNLMLSENEDDIFHNRQQAASGVQGAEVADYTPNAEHVKACSIAVVAERGNSGQSPFRFQSIQKYLGQMPVETSTWIQGAYADQAPDRTADPIGWLQHSLSRYVIMADGTVKSITADLDLSKMATKDVSLLEGPDENSLSRRNTTIWAIPYKLQHSMLQGTLTLDQREWTGDSAKVQAGYDQACKQLLAGASKTGMPQRVKQNWDVDWNAVQENAKPATEMADVPYKVNGSSDYVKFVASNIVAGNMFLDITEYDGQPGAPHFGAVLNEAVAQNPLTLLCLSNLDYEIRHDGGRVLVALSDNADASNNDAEQLVKMRQETSDAVDRLIKENFTDGMSDEDKVKKIMEVIDANIKYDHNYYAMRNGDYEGSQDESGKKVTDFFEDRGYSAYAIAGDGYSVCSGYATLFKLFADRLDLDCYYVTGDVPPNPGSDLTGHAWNIVKISDAWKVVDVTWSDKDGSDGVQYDGSYTLLDYTDASLAGRTYDKDWLANNEDMESLVPEQLFYS